MSTKAILTDTTLCTGCEKCVAACKEVNRLGPDRPRRWQLRIDDLSATRFTTVVRHDGQFVREQCRHCVEPACVSACLVGAMQKTAEGPVVYDSDRCMGCRYCMVACPFEVPRYDWASATPTVRKCNMCAPRLAAGRLPACVEACPQKATIFGERDELLAEAHRRIQARARPYVDRVYGETDVGGTSVIMISSVPLDFLAAGMVSSQPLPELTWAALSKVPPLALGVGGLMAGVFWITGRRMKLEAERLAQAAARTDEPAGRPAESDRERDQ